MNARARLRARRPARVLAPAALAVLALALGASCDGDRAGGPGPGGDGGRSAAAADGVVPSANFDLEKVLGRSVGDTREVGGPAPDGGAAFGVDGLGVALPVPPPLPVRDLVRTADGLLAHARGARLHRAQGVVEGDQVQFSARLRNVSGEPLRLTRIEGECKCIDARGYLLDGDARARELWPGDEVPTDAEFEVLVHLDTTDRTGELQLEGILDYRGAAAPLKFGVLTDVAAVYRFRPPHALQAGVVLGQPHESRVHVTSPLAERFRLEVDTASLPRHLSLVFRPLEPDADGYAAAWVGTFRVAADAPDQALLRTRELPISITAAPSGPEAPPVTYPRTIEVGYRTSLPVEFVQSIEGPNGRPRLVSGSAVAFGVLEAGDTAERVVTLVAHDGWVPQGAIEVELRDVVRVSRERLPEGALTAAWVEPNAENGAAGAHRLRIRLTNADDELAGPMNAQFVVRVGHPDVPELFVNVSALLR